MTAPDSFRAQLVEALPRLRRYARALPIGHAAGEDLVQATLERALTHWHRYDPQRDLVVWLLTIAHHLHLDQWRRDQRWSPADEAFPQGVEATVAAAPAVDIGLRLDMASAWARLSADHREVLWLVGVEALSYAEAAQVLGIPAGTVMSRLARARQALRRWLDGTPLGVPTPAPTPPSAPSHLKRVV